MPPFNIGLCAKAWIPNGNHNLCINSELNDNKTQDLVSESLKCAQDIQMILIRSFWLFFFFCDCIFKWTHIFFIGSFFVVRCAKDAV